MRVDTGSLLIATTSLDQPMSSESILARELLATLITGERLDGKMYTLVSFQVVITIEALNTLITFERSIYQWDLGLIRWIPLTTRCNSRR